MGNGLPFCKRLGEETVQIKVSECNISKKNIGFLSSELHRIIIREKSLYKREKAENQCWVAVISGVFALKTHKTVVEITA